MQSMIFSLLQQALANYSSYMQVSIARTDDCTSKNELCIDAMQQGPAARPPTLPPAQLLAIFWALVATLMEPRVDQVVTLQEAGQNPNISNAVGNNAHFPQHVLVILYLWKQQAPSSIFFCHEFS